MCEMTSLAPSDTMHAFIAVVRERMETEGLNNRELARRCGIDENNLSRLLGGRTGSATTKTMDRIADGLGLRLSLRLEEK